MIRRDDNEAANIYAAWAKKQESIHKDDPPAEKPEEKPAPPKTEILKEDRGRVRGMYTPMNEEDDYENIFLPHIKSVVEAMKPEDKIDVSVFKELYGIVMNSNRRVRDLLESSDLKGKIGRYVLQNIIKESDNNTFRHLARIQRFHAIYDFMADKMEKSIRYILEHKHEFRNLFV